MIVILRKKNLLMATMANIGYWLVSIRYNGGETICIMFTSSDCDSAHIDSENCIFWLFIHYFYG